MSKSTVVFLLDLVVPMRRRQQRRKPGILQKPWQLAERQFAPVDILSEDQVEDLHQATLGILNHTGVHFMGKRARDFLTRQNGTKVDETTQIVRFDPDMVEEVIAHTPRAFRIHARNTKHDLIIDGCHLNYANVITPPYASDLDGGRRNGSYEEMCELLRLCQGINALNFVFGYPVEPQDLHPETRHLRSYLAHIELTDKVWRGYTMGDDRIRDAIEMARIARGLSQEQLCEQPGFIANVTTNSPLRIDEPMGDGLMIMAEHNQPVSITSFAMAGAIAPITIAGAVAMQNAEILAAIVLNQLVRPGAPIVYGTFTTNVYMRTGAIAFGGPDLTISTLASGQLARRYGFPLKSSVTTGAKQLDAQAGYETQSGLWGAVASGATIIAHACGWMESGLTVSREKMIIDAEMIQMMNHSMQPLKVDIDTLALDTIHEIGPGGQYFDCAHTMQRYDSEYYEPLVSDWESHENWVEKGSLSSAQRANRIWKKLMEDYQPPSLEESIREELETFVAKREEVILANL